MTSHRRLAFISPRFLFPTDSGGKIRTTQILRGLKGGAFHVILAMPDCDERARFGAEIAAVSDEQVFWDRPANRGKFDIWRKLLEVRSRYPISVASDRDPKGSRVVRGILDSAPDLIVFDFPHSAVLAPARMQVPAVMFTHNVESEIMGRHVEVARSPWMRALWRNQLRKMRAFERHTLSEFDTVIAVSDRDRRFFEQKWQITNCRSIPTGVDTGFFQYRRPDSRAQVVFCGSMDWIANIDAIEFFHRRVWPFIREKAPHARMKVVGRSPPAALVHRISVASPEWEFTGFVDDVREHVGGAAAFVIPLRVGGGTRIKAFEAMAMGAPVASTTIGVEGLPVTDGVHVLVADEPEELAAKVVSLLTDEPMRMNISEAARRLVESEFGFWNAAKVFEAICLETIERRKKEATPGPEATLGVQ